MPIPFKIKRTILHVISRLKLALNSPHTPMWLNIGAGRVKGDNGWITVDVNRVSDLWWDASCALPFKNGVVDRIYSSHMLEHLPHDQIGRFLKDCYRVLRVGGEISIVVPDAAIYLDAYFKKETLPELFLSHKPAVYSSLPIDMVNYMAYMGGEHRYLFTNDNLLHVLREAGFRNAEKRDFDPLIDVPARQHESIYAVATKGDG